tara:strand:+ start:972 stop:1679 length:708 start_codon:yes stop_codon:yes gene_type:complete
MPKPIVLFLVEQNDTLRVALKTQLQLEGEFCVHDAADGKEALLKLEEVSPDLLIVGSSSGVHSEKLCRLPVLSKGQIPIIALEAKKDEVFAESLHSKKLFTVLQKPFKYSTLLTSIRSFVQRCRRNEITLHNVGPYDFNPVLKTLIDPSSDERVIRLTEKEAEILSYLCGADGKRISRVELLEKVWGYNSGVTTHTLETHLYRLRKKIERDPTRAEILLTEPGGYRLGFRGILKD